MTVLVENELVKEGKVSQFPDVLSEPFEVLDPTERTSDQDPPTPPPTLERKAFSDEIGKLGVKSSGYIGFSAKVRQAAEAASQITGDQWSPAEIQETVWSVSKAIVERRRSEGGSGLSATDLLKQGLITDVDVADVPDFATLFSNSLTEFPI